MLVRDIAAEERPDVIAAEMIVLFDQQSVEVGLALGQGQGDQAASQAAPQNYQICVARRHDGRCSVQRRQRNHRLAAAPERAIVCGDG